MAAENGQGARRIDELSQAVNTFLISGIADIPQLRVNGELAIGTFSDGGVSWLDLHGTRVANGSPFFFARTCQSIVSMVPSGGTPMAQAIERSLDALEIRKGELQTAGLQHEFRPNIFLLTDGQPSSSITEAVKRLHAAEDAKQVILWAVGTGGANRETLEMLAGADGTYMIAEGYELQELFSVLSKSLQIQGGLDDHEATGAQMKKAVADDIASQADLADAFESY